MICKDTEETIDRAVAFVMSGHRVIIARGNGSVSACLGYLAIGGVAGKLCCLSGPGYRAELGGVKRGNQFVVVQRIPFDQGAGLVGWTGAIVLHPSVEEVFFGRRKESVLELVKETHLRSGVEA